MQRLRDGEIEALGALYVRHAATVNTALRRSIPSISEEDLQELNHEVFLTLHQTAARFNPDMQLKPWIYGIAVKKARNSCRSSWLHRWLLERHAHETVGMALSKTVSPAQKAETQEQLSFILERLPKEQRDVLWLNIAEGFSGEEIAKILGIRAKTVWTRLYRARKAIRRQLSACVIDGAGARSADEAL